VTTASFLLVCLVETFNAAGQLFFKHAMGALWETGRRKAYLTLGGGVAVMAVSFFVWLKLLQSYDLSQLYPFEAMTRLLLLGAAGLFLREKITPQLWGGAVLIAVGILLVAIDWATLVQTISLFGQGKQN
jgi:drug/metabolite transporter (DMT)-like permease